MRTSVGCPREGEEVEHGAAMGGSREEEGAVLDGSLHCGHPDMSELATDVSDFSVAIMPYESQFSVSYVEDSHANIDQMPLDSEVFKVKQMVPSFVLALPNAAPHVAP
ncbi:hypothetical protein D1007_26187 [Hordeum vulgare]|nr:hypothetical protein D1007_26187 [Hordeum vulgare]